MVEIECADVLPIVVLHAYGQRVQNHGEVFLVRFDRDGLGLLLLIVKLVLGLGDGCVPVGKALIVEGLFDQFLGIGSGAYGVRLDILLHTVQVLDDRCCRDLHGIRAERKHECHDKRDAGCYQFFHVFPPT